MATKKKSTKSNPHAALREQVLAAIGKESFAALASQPLTLAAENGIEGLLQAACEAAAGHPQPLESAIALLRVSCGSPAKPEPKPEPKAESSTDHNGSEADIDGQ